MEPTFALNGIRGIGSQDLGTDATPFVSPDAAPGGPSFVDALRQAAGQTVDTLRSAEQVSMKAITGEADMRDVTDAVLNAEQNLQAAIAIRDKIVTAFLEISRMQI